MCWQRIFLSVQHATSQTSLSTTMPACTVCHTDFNNRNERDQHMLKFCVEEVEVQYPNQRILVKKINGKFRCFCAHHSCPKDFATSKTIKQHMGNVKCNWDLVSRYDTVLSFIVTHYHVECSRVPKLLGYCCKCIYGVCQTWVISLWTEQGNLFIQAQRLTPAEYPVQKAAGQLWRLRWFCSKYIFSIKSATVFQFINSLRISPYLKTRHCKAKTPPIRRRHIRNGG